MKFLSTIGLAIVLAITAVTSAFAETPNSTTMGWREYAEASGCVFVDMGGYLNVRLAADQTDPCPSSVRAGYFGAVGPGSVREPGPDGILGTDDDTVRSDH